MITAVDQIITARLDPRGPGMAIAVAHNGTIHTRTYGFANLEWQIPTSVDTVFRLASITKPITAIAVLQLEQQGRLRLDEPVSTYAPNFSDHGHTITLTHLLTQTSGIKNYSDLAEFTPRWSKQELTPHEMLALISGLPLDFEPGSRFAYSNSNYIILGHIIEIVTGKNYAEFIQEQIFSPLGMTHSHYFHHATIIPRRATGYARTETGYENAPFRNISTSYSSGGMGSTVEDLLKLDQALRTYRLLDKEVQERMFTPATLSDGKISEYGSGWFVEKRLGQRVAFHPGGTEGFSTLLLRVLDLPLTIVILANQSNLDVSELGLRIGRVLLKNM